MSFINNAYADGAVTAAAHSSPQSTIMSFLPMIIIFALFWFLLIRPQQKKTRLLNQMIASLAEGDQVVTTGGIIGKIVKVSDTIINLEIADGVVIAIQKNTISGKVDLAAINKK